MPACKSIALTAMNLLLAQAVSKRHSTTEEALRVAASMGAYRTILTHFSQRYPKIPVGIPTSGAAADLSDRAVTA